MTIESDRRTAGPRVWLLPDLGPTNPYLGLLASALRDRGLDAERVRRRGRRPLSRAAASRGRPDIIHLQWHHRFFVPRTGGLPRAIVAGSAFLIDCVTVKRAGVPLVWTVHNLVNHERRLARWERTACRILARLVDRLHVHCEAAVPLVARTYGVARDRIAVVPHGHYMDAYPPPPGRAEARRALGLPDSATVFLFFGQIRAYKGVDALIDRFRRLRSPDLRLLVVGEPRSAALRREVERRAAADDRVRLRLEFTDGDELARYLSASDAAVLPYRDVLTSGSAILAASLARPVIVPAVGCLAEMPGRGAIAYDPDAEDGLGRALEVALEAPLDRMGEEARRHVARFPWSDVAARLDELYGRLVPGWRTGVERPARRLAPVGADAAAISTHARNDGKRRDR